ncbi:MAG: acetolactate decarboxylase [Candidatus Sedimenticola sp. PURPLELP]
MTNTFKPRYLLVSALIFPLLASQAFAQGSKPFALKHFGHFKKMMHMKKTDGVVNLKQAVNLPHVYAVGAPAHGTGEITVIDGRLWLDDGADGLGNARHAASNDEQAVILVRAQVKKWLPVTVPEDMDAKALYQFILEQASSNGLDTGAPFPFLIEGDYYDLDWHVLNGVKKHSSGGHKAGGIYKKIKEQRTQTAGTLVGFYSAATQGVYTHPGESWHIHVVFEQENKAGHVDALSVRKGSVLKLPVDGEV